MNNEPPIPVTLTVVESRPNFNVILSFNADPPHLAYILSFHLSLESALDAAFIYLYTSSLSGTFARPKHSFRLADPPPKQPHVNVALSDEAWAYFNEQTELYRYNGRAYYLGVSVYLIALLDANPNPTDWIDNRHNIEPDLPEYNDARVEDNQLPVWNDDELGTGSRNYQGRRRRVRSFPTGKIRLILSRLEPIALAHKLTPAQDKRDLLNRQRWASAALEAIGLRYLVPRNEPRINPMPAKRDRRHHKDAAKADERFPFF
jgi:hypothetical protein